ncbi:hypothetical protein Zmor_000469 [Zophobas morio]|uniref:Aminopeptidase N n=1 Tax=Zophobas morio TaxID=2755281 RepID=A0AA38IWM8_9CUCU|nr:hypothetical protein Zmor_000469 [Zophobas morio]
MWRLLCVLALVISSDTMPKKYSGIQLKKPVTPRASANRLDANLVQPTHYALDLTVTKDDLENKAEFSGNVQMTLTVGKDTDSFQIHAKDLTFSTVTLTKSGFSGVITTEGPDTDDIVTIKSNQKITSGDSYILEIQYTGKLSDTDMDGFYRSRYTDDDGKTKYLATTQFEEMGARRAFPCFDEPSFKATFDITITYPSTSIALSNTQPKADPSDVGNGLVKVTFETTPKMSTYLIAFIVSEFKCVSGKNAADGTPTEVCGRPGTEGTFSVALEAAPAALDTMQGFTRFGYASLGNKKMTQAAIPDFAIGAMENWGMITYRESDLLWDENQSSNYDKQIIFFTKM